LSLVNRGLTASFVPNCRYATRSTCRGRDHWRCLIAEGQFDTTRVFAALVMLGLLGTALFYVNEFTETLLLPWHPSHRARHENARG
jgi:hypothetical protein